jgi:hypothetical protein
VRERTCSVQERTSPDSGVGPPPRPRKPARPLAGTDAGVIHSPPMRRKLFSLAAGASAVVCIALCVLWVRSGSQLDELRLRFPRHSGTIECRTVGIGSCFGRLWIEWSDNYFVSGSDGFELSRHTEPAQKYAPWSSSDWGVATLNALGGTVYHLSAPHWAIVVVLLSISGTRIAMGLQRRLRARIGRCFRCGYDLRATPDRCPECGTAAGGERAA